MLWLHAAPALIEGEQEHYIFPVLAQKLPGFKDEHPEEHKAIHDGPCVRMPVSIPALKRKRTGLDRFTKYVRSVQDDPTTYDPQKLREVRPSR